MLTLVVKCCFFQPFTVGRAKYHLCSFLTPEHPYVKHFFPFPMAVTKIPVIFIMKLEKNILLTMLIIMTAYLLPSISGNILLLLFLILICICKIKIILSPCKKEIISSCELLRCFSCLFTENYVMKHLLCLEDTAPVQTRAGQSPLSPGW